MPRRSPGSSPSGGQCRGALGDNDRTTLNAQHLLEVAQRRAGQLAGAEDHVTTAWIGLSRAFGKDSTNALAARLSQALNWLAIERYLEARTVMEQSWPFMTGGCAQFIRSP